MPATALNHFQQDLARARAILAHADLLPTGTPGEQLLRSDLLRSAWMFAVGALDAYFCDAYTDVVAATIISKSRQPAIALPDFFHEIKFPVRAILEPYDRNLNWRWRMAARKMMERETVLHLKTIQDLFNKFFRKGHRFFGDLLAGWIIHPDATKRVFKISATRFHSLAPALKANAVADAYDQMRDRYTTIFQRRHDCIHNCDRPRVAPQSLTDPGIVAHVCADVDFLVRRCDEHIASEFREFLLSLGFTGATISQVGY
jgi:hypothetical protein